MTNTESFISSVIAIVNMVLTEKGITGNSIWHYGLVTNVNSDGTLDVRIDGSDEATKRVRANPDVDFKATDRVILLYVNGDAKNAFVFCRRNK